MGLAEMQAALARLSTDRRARDELRAEPNAFAEDCGLSAEELGVLAGEMNGEITAFARSLRQKRWREALRAMPLAAQVLGSRCRPLFHSYADAIPLGAARNPALDALAFHHWLLQHAELSFSEREAMRYEIGWLTMQHTDRRFLLRLLLVPGARRTSRSVAVWWRWRGRLRHWVVPQLRRR